MTERLYYDDSYTIEFTAGVIEHTTANGRPAVVLDQTYFYPAGGGQPCDTGTISGVNVVEVFTRPEDQAVVHVLDGALESDVADCRINWQRRFDHMQQHTGQHILSRAFMKEMGANTTAFHLGADSLTIDLDTSQLAPAQIEAVEDLANEVVTHNRPVIARLVSEKEFAALNVRMRKMPDRLVTDGLRVVEIAGFDATACGGTHVERTGAIGMIKIVKAERINAQEARIEFCCGKRALRDYRMKNAVANQLAADLTVGAWEIDQAVGRLRSDLKEAQRALRAAQERLLEFEAADLLSRAAPHAGVRVVKSVLTGWEIGRARALASRLVEAGDVIALCGVPGEKAQLIFGRSAPLTQDMVGALKHALAGLGTDRGGGKPEFAQGGGIAADAQQIGAALDAAEKHLFG